MTTKTKQEIDTQVAQYLNKAKLHLYVTETGYLYKILPMEKDGKMYITTLMIGKENVIINTSEAVSDYMYKTNGNGTANVVKKGLFPDYYKTKSIPNFKRMKALIEEIKGEINLNNNLNKDLIEKIKIKVVELELFKEKEAE
jgi:hypothetical protein